MASGDTLIILSPQAGSAPSTSATWATFDTMPGANSATFEAIPVLDFDDTTQEYVDFYCIMPQHYAGGGLTVRVIFSAAEAASDVVEWQAAFRRVADDAENLLTVDHTYAFNLVVATAPSVVGEVAYDTITFTDGADMDSVVAGDYFIMRFLRNPTPSSGTDVTGDASLHMIEIQES